MEHRNVAPAEAINADQQAPTLPSVSLPKGGGAVRGIGETFSVNPVTGTATCTIPLSVSPGRASFAPAMSISYDSGSGNGPFGLGWSLPISSISRKTEKTLPRYLDEDASDVFLFSGVDDLVRAYKDDGTFDTFSSGAYQVQRYRPRIEGVFARIEKWTDASGDVHWRTLTSQNLTTLYGQTAASRISDPADARRVYKWLIDETRDDRGNVMTYTYKPEDSSHVDATRPEEKNRLLPASLANLYPKRIFYGNRVPFQAGDWLFQIVFDYGEHDATSPTPDDTAPWPCRQDAFSSYRAGFEIRTYRLCRRVLMFHHFEELGPDPYLVKSTDIDYKENPTFSTITAVTQSSYLKNGAAYQKKSVAPVEFTYTEAVLDEDIHTLDADSLENIPAGVDGSRAQWVDLNSEGLSGILTENHNAWFYKRNLGGTFGPLETVATKPSPGSVNQGAQLIDIANEGHKSLVYFDGPTPGFSTRTTSETWTDFHPFAALPNVNWKDPNHRLIDLNADGLPEFLITEDEVFAWYPSKGKEGFGARETVPRVYDDEKGPALIFDDPEQTIYLADMSGDGLTDVVRIRNGDICYWPNLGYARFGAKVTMALAPAFDTPDLFDQSRIRLIDIDGTGPTDLIYLGRETVTYWLNQSGNRWSAASTIDQFPRTDRLSSVSAVDLLGNGTACLVWSSPLVNDASQPLRYIALTSGIKPHLLSSVVNNMGSETRHLYAPSTTFYLQDELAGTPWMTKLAFPVHVVETTEVYDHITGSRFVSTYSYHHGYYDGAEQEFRGFGRVDQTDTESYVAFQGAGLFPKGSNALDEGLHVPPVLTKTWYHTGAFIDGQTISRQFASEYYDQDVHPQAAPLTDTLLPGGLSTLEQREACRALKGSMLRQEVYALDNTAQSEHPYTVSENTYRVKRIQPFGENPHAVFFPHACESLNFHYERNPDDPRVGHKITLTVDAFGQATQSATIGYPRRGAPPYAEQTLTSVIYNELDLINQADQADWYRLGIPMEARTYELTIAPAANGRYQPEALTQLLNMPGQVNGVPFEATPALNTKRLLKRNRNVYYKNDLSGPLPAGQIESLALPYQAQAMAFTSTLVSQLYAGRVTDAVLTGAKYVSDGDWWVPSTRLVFSPAQFYMPTQSIDLFGNVVSVSYDAYALLLVGGESSQDPVFKNKTSVTNDYRLLAPVQVTDANGNRSQVAFDVLGRVVATAVMGKTSETKGDSLAGLVTELDDATVQSHLENPLQDPLAILGQATNRCVYDVMRYYNTKTVLPDGTETGEPCRAYTLIRQTHAADLSSGQTTAVQHQIVYSDGFGRALQTKTQAAPGLAPVRDMNGHLEKDVQGQLIQAQTSSRWIGNGRTVFNNKGKPVKQYDPFFSSTPAYEAESDLVQTGVTALTHYDPLERVVRIDHADGTFSKIDVTPWQQASWDVNDTVLDSLWFAAAGSPSPSGPEPSDPAARSVWLAAQHANTPAVGFLDSLGRTFLGIADAGAAGQFKTTTTSDILGNTLAVIDHLGRVVMTHRYNMMTHSCDQDSMDAGERQTFLDATGKPVWTWDSRGHAVNTLYDVVQRPTHIYLQTNGGAPVLTDRFVYGESVTAAATLNLRGKIFQHYDSAGVATHQAYDFKGNLLSAARRLATHYQQTLDWVAIASATTAADVTAAAEPLLENETFVTQTTFDALNRLVTLTTPDQSVTTPVFDEANHLQKASTAIHGAATSTVFVQHIDYDAKGRRTQITYGNTVSTAYTYDPLNFRMTRLLTRRSQDILQDLNYTFDPMGNLTDIRDDAQSTIYFQNAVVTPSTRYVYDPLYRLTSATGREHIGQLASPQVTNDDSSRMGQHQPTDGQAMRSYVEAYDYDAVGNLLQMIHTANQGNWTRRYQYAADAHATPPNNRLFSTSLPGDPANDSLPERYTYDPHGNMLQMPYLSTLSWNEKDQLSGVDLGGGGIAYYVYDAEGQRARKVIENQGSIKERIYLGGCDIYRERVGAQVSLERWTLHVMDDHKRIALVETQTVGGAQTTTRYQFGNHLGSASLELDEQAALISYEEYYPFGSTSYQSVANAAEVKLKRYRYTAKERDDETQFYYHGARYYAPWLGRWTAADPIGIGDGLNVYSYVKNNPIIWHDPQGTEHRPASDGDKKVAQLTDQQLYTKLTKMSPTERYDFADGTTKGSAFADRTWKMLDKYHMERILQLKPVEIVGRLPKAPDPNGQWVDFDALFAQAPRSHFSGLRGTPEYQAPDAPFCPSGACHQPARLSVATKPDELPGKLVVAPLVIAGGILASPYIIPSVSPMTAIYLATATLPFTVAGHTKESDYNLEPAVTMLSLGIGYEAKAVGKFGELGSASELFAAQRGTKTIFLNGHLSIIKNTEKSFSFATTTNADAVAKLAAEIEANHPGAAIYIGSGGHGTGVGGSFINDSTLLDHVFFLEDEATLKGLQDLGIGRVLNPSNPADLKIFKAAEKLAQEPGQDAVFTIRAWCYSARTGPL